MSGVKNVHKKQEDTRLYYRTFMEVFGGFSGNGIRPGAPNRSVVAARGTTLTGQNGGKKQQKPRF
jgi:hypothetical protein